MNKPSVYVGTYAKYNNGSISGEWVDLTRFTNADDFYDYCRELHSDESDPEFMFQDYEHFPYGYITECYLNPAIFDILNELTPDEYADFCKYVSYFGKDVTVESFRDAYIGHYDSKEDFAHEIVEQAITKGLPDFFVQYFDYESLARDLFIDGYVFIDGIVYHAY